VAAFFRLSQKAIFSTGITAHTWNASSGWTSKKTAIYFLHYFAHTVHLAITHSRDSWTTIAVYQRHLTLFYSIQEQSVASRQTLMDNQIHWPVIWESACDTDNHTEECWWSIG